MLVALITTTTIGRRGLMNPKRLDEIAANEKLHIEDKKYLTKAAQLIRLTTSHHGHNGLGCAIDNHCHACTLVMELEDIETN
jgi:hypothetical protein